MVKNTNHTPQCITCIIDALGNGHSIKKKRRRKKEKEEERQMPKNAAFLLAIYQLFYVTGSVYGKTTENAYQVALSSHFGWGKNCVAW
jgi:hypothetical protein